MDVLEVLNEECPYDMEPGDYWIMLRELYERKRVLPTIWTRLKLLEDGSWVVMERACPAQMF